MKKCFLVVFLTGYLLLNLCACSNSPVEQETGDSANPEQSQNSEDSSEAGGPSAEATATKRTTHMTVYGPNDEVYYWHEYAYDGDGNRTAVTSYNASGAENGHVDIVYNDHGNRLVDYTTAGVGHSHVDGVLLPSISERTGTVSPVEKEYDGTGNLTREFCESLYLYEYEYDDTGKRICRKQLSEDGNMCYTYQVYEYDAAGNLATTKQYSSEKDDTVNYSWAYEYNNEGLEVRCSMYAHTDDGMFLNQYTECEYNGTALSKFSSFASNGNLESYTVFQNDEQIHYEIDGEREILWTRTVYSYN